jgi:hypothetical protein
MSSARQGLFAAAGFAEAQGSLHYRHKLRPHVAALSQIL